MKMMIRSGQDIDPSGCKTFTTKVIAIILLTWGRFIEGKLKPVNLTVSVLERSMTGINNGYGVQSC